MSARLRVTIDLPGFWVDGSETEEDIDVAMDLRSSEVLVVFVSGEGDSPDVFLRNLAGTLVKAEVVGAVASGGDQ